MKRVLKALVPPLVWDAARRLMVGSAGGTIEFRGDYHSWAAAMAVSTGYDAPVILRQSIEAMRRVTRGSAAYERDGVTFSTSEFNFPLVWALLRTALHAGRLHVLDVGGSLGSTYTQNRAALPPGLRVHWSIVEQSHYVEAGQGEFATPELSFYPSVDAAVRDRPYDVVLLSGVLQYLPDPDRFLDALMAVGIPTLILDRVPLLASGGRRLTVQHVPPSIYPASYPAWFFARNHLLAAVAPRFELISEWGAVDRLHLEGDHAEFLGFLFESNRSGIEPHGH